MCIYRAENGSCLIAEIASRNQNNAQNLQVLAIGPENRCLCKNNPRHTTMFSGFAGDSAATISISTIDQNEYCPIYSDSPNEQILSGYFAPNIVQGVMASLNS